jgi:6-phosphofructokinase 1
MNETSPQIDLSHDLHRPMVPELAFRRTVAVLFSGSDAPGMNPLLRFLVRLGINRYGARVLGVKGGYTGLLHTARQIATGQLTFAALQREMQQVAGASHLAHRGPDIVTLGNGSVSGLAARGGVILGAGRCPEFFDANVRAQVAGLLCDLEVDGLMVVGGDGTVEAAETFAAEAGIPVIGIPATIDDDLDFTEVSLGFDTAVNTIIRAVEQIQDTASAHHRIMIIETMGRQSGNLARTAALAAGVEIAITPERGPLTLEKMRSIACRLEESFLSGQSHAIVLVAEGVRTDEHDGVKASSAFRSFLETHLSRTDCPVPGIEVRDNVLGHIQRGGSPTVADRVLAARFAEAAWEALLSLPPRSGVLGARRGQIQLRGFERANNSMRSSEHHAMFALQRAFTNWEPSLAEHA